MSEDLNTAAPLLSTLTERLRGVYRVGVNDGAGLLNGEDTFTSQFETPPIQREAATYIEHLLGVINTAKRLLDEDLKRTGIGGSTQERIMAQAVLDAALKTEGA